jgi:hypothetical protein
VGTVVGSCAAEYGEGDLMVVGLSEAQDFF